MSVLKIYRYFIEIKGTYNQYTLLLWLKGIFLPINITDFIFRIAIFPIYILAYQFLYAVLGILVESLDPNLNQFRTFSFLSTF